MSDNSIQLNTTASILFVGNSFTFGRVDPVMSYNAANVRDLTAPVAGTTFANTTGSNPYEPHPWGGVPGIFKAMTDQIGLNYDVAISARNAATLQGQYLNSNPAGWDLRGNVASQSWDTLVLQDNSTQALPTGSGSITFAAGSSTATLVIDPTSDTRMETDETVVLQITANSAYRTSAGAVTGTILNDDPTGPSVIPALPTVTLVANPSAVLEDGTQTLVYTFTRTGSTAGAITVQFAAARDGSTAPSVATTGGDFENLASQFTTSFRAINATTGAITSTTGSVSFTAPGSGSVVIPAGASSVTFTLDPRADTTVETDESIRLTLSANAAYNVGTQGAVAVTILNDDFAAGTDLSVPNITLNLPTSSVYENGTDNLIYQFGRTGSTAAPLTVQFSVNGTATLPGSDFAVTGANSFTTAGADTPNLQSFNTYAVALAQYATTGAANGTIPANTHANAATEVYLYETWARPNLVAGALVSTTDNTTGVVTTSTTTAPEYYTSLEGMTADLRAAYEGLAAANPIFRGVAPVGAAFLQAVQNGTATRNPYASDALTDGRIDLWWDDNLHASKYGSYLSALTLFGTITGLDPRSLGAAETAAAALGITPAEAAALQAVAAATLGLTLNAHWAAPGQVTELQGGSGLLATAGAFSFSDSNLADTHTVTVTAVTPGALGTLTAQVHADSTGDGTGGAVNWIYTVDNAAISFLNSGGTRVEHFSVTVTDANGGQAQRDVAVTINGAFNDAPTITSNGGGTTATVSIAENTTAVTTVSGSDIDNPVNALSYSLVGGADQGLFQIDSTTGALSFKSAPDFEAPADAGANNVYDVIVQVSDGNGGTATQAIAVTVTNVLDGGTVTGTAGNDTLTSLGDGYTFGLGGNDLLVGTSSNERFYGGDGNDTIRGGAGADIVYGDAGTDTIDYSNATGGVYVNLGDRYAYKATTTGASFANPATAGAYTTDYLISIENVTGSAFNDRLYGTTGDNVFRTGTGADIVYGVGGNDTIDYSDAVGGVYVQLGDRFAYKATTAGASFTNPSTVGAYTTDYLIGVSNVTGSAFNDRLYGTAADNVFRPGAGADIVYGLGGTDTVDYSDNVNGVYVQLGDSFANKYSASGLAGGSVISTDFLIAVTNAVGSSANDRLYGTSGGNTLSAGVGDDIVYGLAGNDVIDGGAGNDALIGGDGADTLTGGTGADKFTFGGTETGGVDLITDFSAAEGDRIYLRQGGFGSYIAGDVVHLEIGFSLTAPLAAGFGFNTSTGALYFDADGSGASATRQIATLQGVTSLTAGSLVIYTG